MAYTKHNFAGGHILKAAQLNEMDDQIYENERIADATKVGRVKVIGGWTGITVSEDGTISIFSANTFDIQKKIEWSKPIVAANYVEAVRTAMSEGVTETNPAWTEMEKAGARERIGIGNYRLLHSETADGSSTFVRFDHDDNNNEFVVHDLIVKIEIPATQFNVRFDFYIHDSEWAWKSTGASTYGVLQNSSAISYARIKLYNEAGTWVCESSSNQYKSTANYTHRSYGDESSPVADYGEITGILMYIFGNNNVPSGTKFEFWGR